MDGKRSPLPHRQWAHGEGHSGHLLLDIGLVPGDTKLPASVTYN